MSKDKIRSYRRKEYCFWFDNGPAFEERVVFRVWTSKDRYFDGRFVTPKPSDCIELRALNRFDFSNSDLNNERVSIRFEDIKRIGTFKVGGPEHVWYDEL